MHRSLAHANHASDLAEALSEERINYQALCPGTTLEEHWLAVHDAIDIRNLRGGGDNDKELLYTLNIPWLVIEEDQLSRGSGDSEVFGFYPELYKYLF